MPAVRSRHRLPYMREQAAAILKIADGHSGRETAHRLLLKPHSSKTIYEWVRRNRAEGVNVLKIRWHLKISLKRARQHVHCPDAYYLDKLHQVRVHVPRVPVALE